MHRIIIEVETSEQAADIKSSLQWDDIKEWFFECGWDELKPDDIKIEKIED